MVLHFAGDSTITRCFHSLGFKDCELRITDSFVTFFLLLITCCLLLATFVFGMISAQLDNKTGILIVINYHYND